MPPTIAGVSLDHVAVAVEHWSDAWPRYAVELGGEWNSGGLNVGFGPAQLRFAHGGRVEILQPWQPESNPFLRRFLDRHGPGPHHLTFKVPDLASALEIARRHDFSPVGVDLSNAEWKEAFLHPRQATGIVVQMAQAAYAWESPPPEGFPTDRRDPPASLVRVTHAVADLDTGLALFEGLLGGTPLRRGVAPDGSWHFVDLDWPGPPGFRLIAPAPEERGDGANALSAWLGGLPGRLHHLVFALPPDAGGELRVDPRGAQPPGLLDAEGPARVIEPRDNLGTRLVLVRDSNALES
jgi:catechol 2,3-dioxygenase-like lactoylglutathione lyase family enzyme